MTPKIYCWLLLLTSPISSMACEPASVDWTELYQTMKIDIDSPVTWSDFQKITDFNPYPWPKNQRYQGKMGARNLFEDLDTDHNQVLNQHELARIHLHLPNPCASWPGSR